MCCLGGDGHIAFKSMAHHPHFLLRNLLEPFLKGIFMKRLSMAIVLAVACAQAQADHHMPDQYRYVGVHATHHRFDLVDHIDNLDLESGVLPGLQLGSRITENFSLQLWGESGDLDLKDDAGDIPMDQYFISARYHYHDASLLGFEPYLGFALGHKELDSDSSTQLGAEFGVQRGLTDRLVLDLGMRPSVSPDDETMDSNVYAAINLVIGRASRRRAEPEPEPIPEPIVEPVEEEVPPPVVVVDTDGDGVEDGADQCPDTMAGALVDEQGCHLTLERSVNETLNVQFESGGASVKASSISDIERIAKVMTEYPQTALVIEGHTDSVGSADANLRLSQQRADAVKAVLVEHFNIDASRIAAVGRGEYEPVADNDTPEGRAQNRRVETEISASRTEIQTR